MNRIIDDIYRKIVSGTDATPDDIKLLVAESAAEDICRLAGRIRNRFHGRSVELCSIINARAELCSGDCKWCAQSAHNKTGVPITGVVSEPEAEKQAERNSSAGAKKFSLVTSGESLPAHDFNHMISICRRLKMNKDLNLCASMGLLSEEQFAELRDAGVTRYHCNLETAPSHFHKLCTTHTIDDKLRTIRFAEEAGLSICSGGIIGMGESLSDRIELAFALRSIGADSIPLNILQPIKGTPLENAEPLTDEEVLMAFSLFRIINPGAVIRFAGGRSLILHLQERLLEISVSGAITGDLLTVAGINMNEDIKQLKDSGYDIY